MAFQSVTIDYSWLMGVVCIGVVTEGSGVAYYIFLTSLVPLRAWLLHDL